MRDIKNNLPCDFLDNDDTICVSLLRDYKQSSSFSHTEYLVGRQLLLQRIFDRVAATVDRALSSNVSVKLLYPSGSVVAQVADYEFLLSAGERNESL